MFLAPVYNRTNSERNAWMAAKKERTASPTQIPPTTPIAGRPSFMPANLTITSPKMKGTKVASDPIICAAFGSRITNDKTEFAAMIQEVEPSVNANIMTVNQ